MWKDTMVSIILINGKNTPGRNKNCKYMHRIPEYPITFKKLLYPKDGYKYNCIYQYSQHSTHTNRLTRQKIN